VKPEKNNLIPVKKPELLAPAGNYEKLEIAVHYGADAVYLAGKDFSLRNFSGNFTDQELSDGIKFARQRQVKVYLACNIYSRNHEQTQLRDYLERIGKADPDAVIISDPGIIMLAKEIIPHIDFHETPVSIVTGEDLSDKTVDFSLMDILAIHGCFTGIVLVAEVKSSAIGPVIHLVKF